MSITLNTKHFLHNHLTFIHSISTTESYHYFEKLGIDVRGDAWEEDHSTFNWNQITPHFQFFYDFEGNDIQVGKWLQASKLSVYEHVVIRLEDEIIKVKTNEFITNWYRILGASAFMGIKITTEDGRYFLECTDDWKCHLNSNFSIKP